MRNFPGMMIIIVSFNLKNDTIECIDSYISSGASPEQIIVVDNGSTDGTIEAIRNRYLNCIQLVCSDSNFGYPHALNLGIPLAIEKGAEWVLVSNNDIIVDANFIQELEAAVAANPEYDLFSPVIFYHESPRIVWYCGEKIIPGTLIGIRRLRKKPLPKDIPAILESDMVHGCVMLVSKKVFEKIGVFDDAELIYGDDADFSWRARLAGFKAAVATKAQLWHKISLTINPQKPNTRLLRTRNTIMFYKRYTNGLSGIIMIVFTFFRGIVLTVVDLMQGQIILIKPLWLGWWSGWSGRTSKRR